MTHAVSRRQKRSNRTDTGSVAASGGESQASTKLQGVYPIKPSSTVSIASLLDVVKATYQSILSDDVLRHPGEKRNPPGYHSNQIRYFISGDGEVQGQSLPEVEEKAEADAQGKALQATVREYLEWASVRAVDGS